MSEIIFSECRMIEKDLKNAVAREDFDKAIELQQKLKNIKEIKNI